MRLNSLVAAAVAMLASANYQLPAAGPGMPPTSQRRAPRPSLGADDLERLHAAQEKRARRAAKRRILRGADE